MRYNKSALKEKGQSRKRTEQKEDKVKKRQGTKRKRRRQKMSKILIIGCGGVASVAIQKCAGRADVFSEICIASRTVSKCEALKEKIQ